MAQSEEERLEARKAMLNSRTTSNLKRGRGIWNPQHSLVTREIGAGETPGGKIVRSLTMHCADCGVWHQERINRSDDFAYVMRLAGWVKTRKWGWMCPRCCYKNGIENRVLGYARGKSSQGTGEGQTGYVNMEGKRKYPAPPHTKKMEEGDAKHGLKKKRIFVDDRNRDLLREDIRPPPEVPPRGGWVEMKDDNDFGGCADEYMGDAPELT